MTQEITQAKFLDIAEVARLSGLPASTLRYYEEKGLIHSVGRRGLRRLFEAQVLQHLALIDLGRGAGFSLDDIGAMLTERGPAIDRDRLRAKADEIDKTIQRLSIMRDGLRHAADCKAPSHLACPTFQRLLRIGASGRLRPAKTHGRS
ncbi:MAG: MerR family transcriptional regulator [Alphaproteobacteria bacterium]|nr:MAG: MerR family transcriptional regulator [Alphaproteobacteria bacterium]